MSFTGAAGQTVRCLHCEKDIGPKRLAAAPWTPFRIQCQEITDRSDSADNPEEVLLGAA